MPGSLALINLTFLHMKPKYLCFFLPFLFAVPAAHGADINCATTDGELVDMVKQDQQVRADFEKVRSKNDLSHPSTEVTAFMEKWQKIDHDDTERLKLILRACGWPANQEASHNAWLLAQHADADRAFQHEALSQLQIAVEQGHAAPKDLAYLTDRLEIAEEKKQLYGTQFDATDRCTLVLKPVDSREAVNARRRQIGMESLEDYEARSRRQFTPADCPNYVPPASSPPTAAQWIQYAAEHGSALPWFAKADAHHSSPRASHASTRILFINHLPVDVALDWLDHDGQPAHYADIKAGATFLQATSAGHVWTVSADGKLLGTFVASETFGFVDISRKNVDDASRKIPTDIKPQ